MIQVKASKELEQKCKIAAEIVREDIGMNIFKAENVLQAAVADLESKDSKTLARIFKAHMRSAMTEKRQSRNAEINQSVSEEEA